MFLTGIVARASAITLSSACTLGGISGIHARLLFDVDVVLGVGIAIEPHVFFRQTAIALNGEGEGALFEQPCTIRALALTGLPLTQTCSLSSARIVATVAPLLFLATHWPA